MDFYSSVQLDFTINRKYTLYQSLGPMPEKRRLSASFFVFPEDRFRRASAKRCCYCSNGCFGSGGAVQLAGEH